MSGDRVRVLRVLEYEGPRSWVDEAIRLRTVKGERSFSTNAGTCVIREAITGEVPVMLSAQPRINDLVRRLEERLERRDQEIVGLRARVVQLDWHNETALGEIERLSRAALANPKV